MVNHSTGLAPSSRHYETVGKCNNLIFSREIETGESKRSLQYYIFIQKTNKYCVKCKSIGFTLMVSFLTKFKIIWCDYCRTHLHYRNIVIFVFCFISSDITMLTSFSAVIIYILMLFGFLLIVLHLGIILITYFVR